jgi:phytoene dehydrogenase-like protein
MRKDPDVVVIGGGISGLVAAGLLASRGLGTLLVEQTPRTGGYVTGFRRKGVYFDATGAFVSACGSGDEFHSILEELDLNRRLTFLPIETIWNIYPDFDLRTTYGSPTAYLEAVKQRFPRHERALDRYGKLTRRLGKEFLDFEQAGTLRKVLLPLFFPNLLRYARTSHARILHRFFGDSSRISLALSALPTTLPPSKLSYTFVAVLWAKVLRGGVFYPKGGMEALSDALTQAVRRHGGEVLCDRPVVRILTQGRRAVGVGLADQTEIRASWVIAGINPFHGQRLLTGDRQLYGPLHRLRKYTPSLSALLFYVSLPADSLPGDWPYFISIHSAHDQEEMAAALDQGNMEKGLHMVITTPTVMDPSLAPGGTHSLKVLVHAPRSPLFGPTYGSKRELDRLEDRVFSLIRLHTGLDIPLHARFVERATPMTLAERTGNEGGAMYGLDAACGQVGPQRPPNRTALDNLLWVGHYTHPAHGIVGSAMSGRFAAELVLAANKE